MLRCVEAHAAHSGFRAAAASAPSAHGVAAIPSQPIGLAVSQCRHFSPTIAVHAARDAGPRYGGQTLEEIQSRIFGTHIGNGLPSGRKLLRKKLVGEKIASYYEVPVEKSDPLFESLDDERCVGCTVLWLPWAKQLTMLLLCGA